jgi:CheY-like chemotaxis protein
MAQSKSRPDDLPRLTGLSVLILEDNVDFSEAMQFMLTTCGAGTTAVASVAEARAAVQAHVPDLVITDLVLPDGTGVEFVDWLRELPPAKGGGVAVVAVTAFPRNFPAVTTRGFAAYYVKPLELADLCWTIASILGRGPRPPARS